jgi:hypothetical protein
MGTAYISPQTTTRDTRVLPGTVQPVPFRLTESDLILAGEAEFWGELTSAGLQAVCCPKGRRPYTKKPWVQMPAEGRRFKPVGILPVADVTPFTGLDVPVLELRVPVGYDGVITDLVCEVVAPGATGFVEGSGDVVWRLSANGRFLRDLGDIRVTLGSLVTPSPTPRGALRVFTQNLVSFTVALAPGAEARIDPNAKIVCSVTGWFWPR